MSNEKKANLESEPVISQVEAETQEEIEEIMSEIDELQKDMADAPKATSKEGAHLKAVSKPIVAEEDVMEDFHTQGDSPSIEETLGSMRDDTPGSSLLDDKGSSEEGTLTMILSGNMTLKLSYECDGQEVTIGFSEGALKVQLKDGTEFKIPVRHSSRLRAVA
jgi:hypothetical protein